MGLMLAIWRDQPNWIPKKPKLMFQICQKFNLGFVEVVIGSRIRSRFGAYSKYTVALAYEAPLSAFLPVARPTHH